MSEKEIIINVPEQEEIEYSTEQNKIKLELPVSKINAIAQGYLNYISEISDEDDESSRESLFELLHNFETQENQSGTEEDFFNFAVALARKDEYNLACKVLEIGLNLFPKNVNLLASLLQYGINCGKKDECKKCYKTMMKIPYRRWTWRGFVFLIDYIKYLIEQTDSEKEINAKEEEIRMILSEFRKYHPYTEETYRVEADVYKSLNMHDEELDTLKKALEVLNVAPKCALRCADILFERGNYKEASCVIKRCISDATQTQGGVNEGYIYYLSALCTLADYQKNNREFGESIVLEIYSDFNVALNKLSDSSYAEVIKTKVTTLVSKTGVDIPAEFERLLECVAE